MSNDVPLIGVACPYDKVAGTDSRYGSYAASCWSWTVECTPAELVYLANSYGRTNIGDFVGITMSTTYNGQTSVSGRAMQVTIKGTRDSVIATKDDIRSLLDLKSTLFTISGDGATAVRAYVIGKNDKLTAWEDISGLYAESASGSVVKAGGSDDGFYVLSANGLTKLSNNSVSNGGNVVIKGYGYGHGVGLECLFL